MIVDTLLRALTTSPSPSVMLACMSNAEIDQVLKED